MGKRPKVSHAIVAAYADKHPEMLQADIGRHFGLTQSRVSHILRAAGQRRRKHGRPVERKESQSQLEHDWEKVLHAAGLGMDRGLRINNIRILYGEDPEKEKQDKHHLATF